MMAELYTTINKSILLKTCNQSNTETLSRCTVKIRHNEKCVKFRFFVVQGDNPALLGMLDIELPGIIRVMCETIGNKTTSKKFDSQTKYVAKPDECSSSKDKTNMPDYLISSKIKTNMPDYFNSSDEKEGDKRVNEAITNRIYNEFNDLFSGIDCF